MTTQAVATLLLNFAGENNGVIPRISRSSPLDHAN